MTQANEATGSQLRKVSRNSAEALQDEKEDAATARQHKKRAADRDKTRREEDRDSGDEAEKSPNDDR